MGLPRVACVLAVSLLVTSTVAAQERWADPVAQPSAPQPAAATTEGEREVPDYDGREDQTSVGDALLWIPRVLFSPFYFLTEFVIRRPLGFVMQRLEAGRVPEQLGGLARFGEGDRFFLIPTAHFDFLFRPNAGLYFRGEDVFFDGNDLRMQLSVGGREWVSGALEDSVELGGVRLVLRGDVTRRDDGAFWGLGRDLAEEKRARFGWDGVDASIGLRATPRPAWRRSEVSVRTGVRWRDFDADASFRGPSLDEAVAQGTLRAPAGLEGYLVGVTAANVRFDSRRPREGGEHGSGIRLEGDAEIAMDLEEGPAERLWARYGAQLAAYVDLTGAHHVVSLEVDLRLADALAGAIPFTEMPTIGGGISGGSGGQRSGPMQGFPGTFLSGPSAVAATLRYDWPIWTHLDGQLHFAVGNAFDERFDGFALRHLRMSFGLGITAIERENHFFELILAAGTNTFDAGPKVDSFRVAFGGTRAF